MHEKATITVREVRAALPHWSFYKALAFCAKHNHGTRYSNVHHAIAHNVARARKRADEAEWLATSSPGKRWITLYHEDRAYGGPEEGGWWYTYGTVAITFEVSRDTIRREWFRMLLAERTANEGKPSISSVLSEGRMRVVLSRRRGRPYPEERPYYC